MKLLGQTHTEGFIADIREDDDGRVFFTGDLDIDADGANGQRGARPAYHRDSSIGTEALGNGGMALRDGRVVGIADWWKDIVFIEGGHPLVLPDGTVPSRTAYKFPGGDTPENQVDSETIPYIVVPPLIIEKTRGTVKGCRAACTWRGVRVFGIVGDIGPRTKVGEASIAMARALGIPSSPKSGGRERPDVLFELWPGVHGEVDGKPIPLLRSNGEYIFPPG